MFGKRNPYFHFQLTDMKIFKIFSFYKQKRIFYFQLTDTKKWWISPTFGIQFLTRMVNFHFLLKKFNRCVFVMYKFFHFERTCSLLSYIREQRSLGLRCFRSLSPSWYIAQQEFYMSTKRIKTYTFPQWK